MNLYNILIGQLQEFFIIRQRQIFHNKAKAKFDTNRFLPIFITKFTTLKKHVVIIFMRQSFFKV